MDSATRELIAQQYQEGDSLDTLRLKHPSVPYREIRELILRSGLMRPKFPDAALPSEEEIAREMQRLRDQWSEEESMRRWVGRAVQPQAQERGRYLSAVLRD